jgi:hypothetical protein
MLRREEHCIRNEFGVTFGDGKGDTAAEMLEDEPTIIFATATHFHRVIGRATEELSRASPESAKRFEHERSELEALRLRNRSVFGAFEAFNDSRCNELLSVTLTIDVRFAGGCGHRDIPHLSENRSDAVGADAFGFASVHDGVGEGGVLDLRGHIDSLSVVLIASRTMS